MPVTVTVMPAEAKRSPTARPRAAAYSASANEGSMPLLALSAKARLMVPVGAIDGVGVAR